MTDGEPETAVSASLQKIKSIKNQYKHLFFIFLFHLISNGSDSFVNHFDGHFAYLKTLDFSFNGELNAVNTEIAALKTKTGVMKVFSLTYHYREMIKLAVCPVYQTPNVAFTRKHPQPHARTHTEARTRSRTHT